MVRGKLLLLSTFVAGLVFLVLFASLNSGRAAANPAGLQPQTTGTQVTVDQVVASGFNMPTQVTNAGDGSGRLFVVEQTGKIWIIQNGQVLPTPFLDLTSKVACCGERGLLGLTFHPSYASNGYFYVDYTRASDGATVVARYSVSANPNSADPNSALTLMNIPQPYANHNGGQLMFGPGGYLYIGTGDGGSGGDPQNNAQNVNSRLGKLLRIGVSDSVTYTIPADNPYVGKNGLDEIWSIGLRNPWRFSFDRLTGDLYIGDVGQGLYEEVDFQAANTPGGLNFGWRCKEGFHTYNFTANCQTLSLTDPILEYPHPTGEAITGGFVYRGQDYPAIQGRYFYADFETGRIWSIQKTGTSPTTWSTPRQELDTGYLFSSFGEDENGELYLVDYGGSIRRLATIPVQLYYLPLIGQ